MATSPQQLSDTLMGYYQQYRLVLDQDHNSDEHVERNWGNLPDPLGIEWLPYKNMFDESSCSIAGAIEQLTDYIHRLKAWSIVLAPMTDEQKLSVIFEFIDPIATIALNLPHVIQERFIFAVAHLCHQANRSRVQPWTDNLPEDYKIKQAVADEYGGNWTQYKPLTECLKTIADQSYQKATFHFRNTYNHRFSPRIEVGITNLIYRRPENLRGYGFSYAVAGGVPPLMLSKVVDLLHEQRNRCFVTFSAFQQLVREQEAGIIASQLLENVQI
jgi:hypothetical protein